MSPANNCTGLPLAEDSETTHLCAKDGLEDEIIFSVQQDMLG